MKLSPANPQRKAPSENLQGSLRGVILLGQCLGQLPVDGVSSGDPNSLAFKWKSWKSAFCLVSLSGTVFMMLILTYKMIQSGTDLFIISTFLFHGCKFFTTLAFIYLAKKWPELMMVWRKMEVGMSGYGWNNKFDLKIKVITSVIIVFTLIQYVTNQATNLVLAERCKNGTVTTIQYFYESLTFPFIYTIVDYALWKSLFLQLLDLQTSLVWSYVDLFIIVISCALAMRFQQITDRLEKVEQTYTLGESGWKTLREDYNRLCKLCKCLDEAISYLVLCSFGTNLFFILILLFNSLRDMQDNLYKIYFYFSFAFLILRTIYVSLYAAWINDESKKPITVLNSVPTNVYNLEIRRFIQQISFDTVALTGRNFFNVTRGLILSVAGAIVTYELVLIQFNENLLKKDKLNNDNLCRYKV